MDDDRKLQTVPLGYSTGRTAGELITSLLPDYDKLRVTARQKWPRPVLIYCWGGKGIPAFWKR